MTLVETMVGALILALCTSPIVGCIAWMRNCAAEATIDARVSTALDEQISIVKSLGRAKSLVVGTSNSTVALGSGLTLNVVRTVTSVEGQPRLYDVAAVGTWTSRARGGRPRSMTLETYAFAPDN